MTQIWEHPDWPNFGYDPLALHVPLARCSAALGRLSGLVEAMPKRLASEHRMSERVREAKASAGLAGISPAPGAANLQGEAARGTPPDLDTLRRWHRMLLAGDPLAGSLRSGPGLTSGAETPPGYQPPPADILAEEVQDFLFWLGQAGATPGPVRAAVAYLWLRSLHPFERGNGRLGRLVAVHVLARGGFADAPPLSEAFGADIAAYRTAIENGRRPSTEAIDATGFASWFIDTLTRAADDAACRARHALRRRDYLARHAGLRPRQLAALERVSAGDGDAGMQDLTARHYADLAAVSPATATRDLAEMVEAGAVTRGPEGGRSTRYRLTIDDASEPNETETTPAAG